MSAKYYSLALCSALWMGAWATSARAQNIAITGFPHRYENAADALGDFLGQGKDWFEYPTLTLSTQTTLENDFVTSPGVPNNNNMNANISTFYSLGFAPRLSLQGSTTLQQVLTPTQNTSFFRKEGQTLDETYLMYTNDLVTVQAGKFTPDFGQAWNLAPGVYGGSFASDYSTANSLGGRVAVDFGRELIGTHTLSASLYTADNTIFSNSLFTQTGRLTRSAGGPANTGRLDSYSIALTGVDVPIWDRPIFNYELAFRSQAPGSDGNATEHGESAAIWMPIPLDNDVMQTIKGRYQSINPIVEYVHLENAGGIDGQKYDYLTGAVDYIYGDWDWSVASTWRPNDTQANGHQSDWMVTTSVGYNIPKINGAISVGYMYSKVNGQTSNTVGIMFVIQSNWLNNFQLRRGW